MSQITSFIVDPKKFEIFKEKKRRYFKNFEAGQPYHHAIHWFKAIVGNSFWTDPEIAAALEGKNMEYYVLVDQVCIFH